MNAQSAEGKEHKCNAKRETNLILGIRDKRLER